MVLQFYFCHCFVWDNLLVNTRKRICVSVFTKKLDVNTLCIHSALSFESILIASHSVETITF